MPDVCFIVAGRVMGEFDVPSNMVLLGKLDSQETLAQYYSMADLTILTSKRETFSMVCAESLCCGTPVVGFRAGGPEQIALSAYSSFCEFGRIDDIVKLVWEIEKKQFDKDIIADVARKQYSTEKMVKQYLKIYHEVASV